MVKRGIATILIVITLLAMTPVKLLAVEGSLGYEGGISTENLLKKDEYNYSEMCFITGKPILLTGTLTIKKSEKSGVITATYTYKLTNATQAASLTRVLIYETQKQTKANGQTTESTKLSKLPTEVITIGTTPYTLTDYNFSRSILSDPKPAIRFNAGEFTGKKVYYIGNERANTITVTLSGRLYAYEQYWSSTQTQKILYTIQADMKKAAKPYQWGGSAEVVVTNTGRQQIQYSENEPNQISFEGGYVRKTWAESTLDYTAKLPELDKTNMPTDILKTWHDRISLRTEPVLNRLMVPTIKQLSGHWAEESISVLFGLEVIPGTGANYKTTQYVTRREFTAILINALKNIPEDPNLKKPVTTTRTTKTQAVSPFLDFKVGDLYYAQIKEAYDRGITLGAGASNFKPNDYITRTEAIKMVVTALGLENLAPLTGTQTPYLDNDSIPSYARNAATVAYQLGIFTGDERGNFGPTTKLTNEKVADLIYRLIGYMGDELVKDYWDRMLDF